MAKKKSTRTKEKKTASVPSGNEAASSAHPIRDFFASKGIRETIESVAIAFMLAFLFRTFEAEAFVIPTGSMAPTLMGRHIDFVCPQCGYENRAGASLESEGPRGKVIGAECPLCGYLYKPVGREPKAYTGDRILVSKFIYAFQEPERWDVIVFKNPNNAKQNYIKRLIGKPNETISIRHGDIFVQKPGEAKPHIARKSDKPHKLVAMLQPVHDTDHIAGALADKDVGWPACWRPVRRGSQTTSWKAQTQPNGKRAVKRTFRIESPPPGETAWLRYHHVVPSQVDWEAVRHGQKLRDPSRLSLQLITDHYGYNASRRPYSMPGANGLHWVGDLAVECTAAVESDQGELLLDLVEGGRHYTCGIDVAKGRATLSIASIDGKEFSFDSDDGKQNKHPRADTPVHGPGTYRLRLANCDDQVVLWVNDRMARFDRPTTYPARGSIRPRWNEEDEGDLAPVGVGSRGASLDVSHLKVLRDIYYIAVTYEVVANNPGASLDSDYDRFSFPQVDADRIWTFNEWVLSVMARPHQWAENSPQAFAELFEARRRVELPTLGEDQFLPMGDNSPHSQDGRIWGPNHYVQRRFLVGEALFIYWPHAWYYVVPNLPRMGFVR